MTVDAIAWIDFKNAVVFVPLKHLVLVSITTTAVGALTALKAPAWTSEDFSDDVQTGGSVLPSASDMDSGI